MNVHSRSLDIRARVVLAMALVAAIGTRLEGQDNAERLAAAARAYQAGDAQTVRANLDPYLAEVPHDAFARLMNGMSYLGVDPRRSIGHFKYIRDHFNAPENHSLLCDAEFGLVLGYMRTEETSRMVNAADTFVQACRCHPKLRYAEAILRAAYGYVPTEPGQAACVEAPIDQYAATVESVEMPDVMEAGKEYPVAITVRNPALTGFWDQDAYCIPSCPPGGVWRETRSFWWPGTFWFRLASLHPGWGVSRAFLQAGETVREDSGHSFFFSVTAPREPGTYPWQWQMMRDVVPGGQGTFFGDKTPFREVVVVSPRCEATEPPTVALTSPRPGVATQPDIPLAVEATAANGVSRVEYLLDGALLATSSAAPHSLRADVTSVPLGPHQVSARVYDMCDDTAESAPVSIDLHETGRPPVARNDKVTTRRNAAVDADVVRNDVEPDGQTLFLTDSPITTDPWHGTAVRLSDRVVRYTPAAGWFGNDVFEYEVQDSSGNTARAWVAVRVKKAGGPPAAAADSASTVANQDVIIDVVSNDSSPDGDEVILAAVPFVIPPDHGSVTRVSSTTVAYTPARDFVGSDSFEYEISDGDGGTAVATVTVAVSAGNRRPVAVADVAVAGPGQGVTIDVTANDSDPDGDSVALISSPVTIPPSHGSALRVSGSSIVYVPHPEHLGVDSFQYEIGDGNGHRARATVTVTVTDTNHPPDASDDTAATGMNTAVTVDVTANDSDVDGHPVALVAAPIIAPPANGTAVKISGSSFSYTPRSGFSGNDRFQYEIRDFHGGRARAWVEVTVGSGVPNRNPVAVDDLVTTPVSTGAEVVVTANDSDPDGDTVTLIPAAPIIIAPAHGSVTVVSQTTLRYVPATGFVGLDTAQYEIRDGRGKRARAWLRVTVTDTNNRPNAISDLVSTWQGHAATVHVTSNDTDPDGDVVRLVPSPIIVAPANGNATRVDAYSVRYTPRPGFSGTDRFKYEIADGRGGHDRAWANITVTAGQAASAASAGTVPPIAANELTEGIAATPIPIVAVASSYSVAGRPVVLASEPVIREPLFGSVVRTNDSVLTYTPGPDFRGNDRFQYEVVDTHGLATRAWVAVQIPGDNRAPEANDDDLVLPVAGSLVVSPLANDADADRDPLSLSMRGVTFGPSAGTIRRDGDERLVYSAAPGFSGTDTFGYEITDGRGGVAEGRVVVRVHASQAPHVVNDAATVEAGRDLQLDLLANDSDPTGGELRVVSSTVPAQGTVLWNDDGTVTYRSSSIFRGTDTFTYSVAGATGLISEGRVAIQVFAVNHPPLAVDDSAETTTRHPVLIGVLANDWEPDYGQRLAVSSVTRPASGTVAINGGGESITYSPASTFAGTVTFEYTVSDGLRSATANVSVTVVNHAPVARPDRLATREDTWTDFQAFHVLANDVDPDGDDLHVVSVDQPDHGTFLVSADRTQFSYRAHPDFAGTDAFHYTVSDAVGEQSRVRSLVTVAPVNDPPVASDDAFSTYNRQLLSIAPGRILANDTDVEGDGIDVSAVGSPANGTSQKLADGSIEYRPNDGFVGSDSFEYTIEDGGGAPAAARITVTVLRDDAPVPAFTVGCAGRSCTFDAGASSDDRGIVSYQWLLGNGEAAAGRSLTYTYPSSGTFHVRLTISDTLGQSSILTRTAVATELPPDARDDTFTWRKGSARAITFSSLLANDSDPAGDTLTVASVDAALTEGSLACDAAGCLFTPPSPLWWGQTSFKYTIDDGHGKKDTATVALVFTN